MREREIEVSSPYTKTIILLRKKNKMQYIYDSPSTKSN